MNSTVAAGREIHDGCLCFRARRIARIVTRAFDEALRPHGLQPTQLTLLAAIGTGGEAGQPMAMLIALLALDAATLSRNLRPLERDGLIAITIPAGDRRARQAALTAAGADRLAAALPAWRQAQAAIDRALGQDAATALRHDLDHARAVIGGQPNAAA